jgi:hypothetical protein
MQNWYGTHYVGDYASLARLGNAPWVVIALNRVPGAWDGFKTSWIANDVQLRKTVVHREGFYQIYLLEDSADQR